MVLNTLGTSRNTFKSQQSVKKKKKNWRNRQKIGKIRFFLLKMVSNALGTL